jgi:hypothetical protein
LEAAIALHVVVLVNAVLCYAADTVNVRYYTIAVVIVIADGFVNVCIMLVAYSLRY